MSSLSNVVNVSMQPQSTGLTTANMNVVAIMTSESTGVNSSQRTKSYTTLSGVANDFGSDSQTYAYAKTLFAQTKNPTNSGGRLVVGFYRKVNENIPEVRSKLTGGEIVPSDAVSALQGINDGSFDMKVNGVAKALRNIDFRSIDSVQDIITILEEKVTGVNFEFKDNRITAQLDKFYARAKSDITDIISALASKITNNGYAVSGNNITIANPDGNVTFLEFLIDVLSAVGYKGDTPTTEADALSAFTGLMYGGIASATSTVTSNVKTLKITMKSNLPDVPTRTDEITYLSRVTVGSFIGDALALSDGTGATVSTAVPTLVYNAETKQEAVTAALEEVSFKGCTFIDTPTGAEAEELAVWAKANDVLMYDVFSSPNNLLRESNNTVWKIKLANGENYRMAYRKDGDRRMAVAMMAVLHTVNFNNQNSAITLNMKVLSGISAESFTQDETDKAKRVGLDIYTTFGDMPRLLVSGANGYADNVYNFIAIKNFVQVDLFNLLNDKLAQTTRDVNKIIDTVEKTLNIFKRANVIGAGKWTSTSTFGDLEMFLRAISTDGFYVYAQPVSEQSQADREARKSPVIQVAFKNAGAIHTIDTTIQYNL